MTEQSVMPELDVFNLPVFGVADLFPMVAQDELAELAEDIAENGLQESIVIAQVNGEWMLIDGRNRLAACRLAKINPHYRVLESDPTAYVLSANVHRRHLTKGQQAMATALAYPNPEKGGRGNKINSSKNEEFSRISAATVSMTTWRHFCVRPVSAHLWALTPGGIWRTQCGRLFVRDLDETTVPLTVDNLKIPKCRVCLQQEQRRKEGA